VIQRLLGKLIVACDGEDDRAGRLWMGVLRRVLFDPVHEGGGLILEAQAQKGVDREGGVAHPGVPVVPVASASDDFRQAGGGGCDDRTGRLKGEKL
jgi:hypothetical protein